MILPFTLMSVRPFAIRREPLNALRPWARGFTLLELAITMAIVAIMVMWGAPGLTRLLENQRMRSVVSEFRSAFSIGRFESYGQGRRLVMAKRCALQTGIVADNCRDVNWSAGFVLFVCRADSATDIESSLRARESSAQNCADNPGSFYLTSSSKQEFEGFNQRVRICDAASTSAGNSFRTNHAIVFNPDGSLRGSNSFSTAITNFDFFIFQDRGTDDLLYRMSLSGDGQLSAKEVRGTNFNDATCERLP